MFPIADCHVSLIALHDHSPNLQARRIRPALYPPLLYLNAARESSLQISLSTSL